MTNPLRILFVSGTPPGSATCRYRCEHFAQALRRRGTEVDVVYIGQPRVRVAHDIVVLYRVCATTEGRNFARAARACGAVLVYSTDDLVFDAQDAPAEMGDRFRAVAPLHRAMLSDADIAIASTEYLADRMRQAAPETPVVTLRNFLGEDLIEFSETAALKGSEARKSERVTFGYFSGTPTHDADLAVIAEPLCKVLKNHPSTELLLVGPVQIPASLGEQDKTGQIRRLPLVPWQTLPQLMIEQGVAVNLAPLDITSLFCHAKSEVKFLEAGILGIPTIASSAKGFGEAIPNAGGNEGCFLAADSSDWERWLNLLGHNRSVTAGAGVRAYDFVRVLGRTETNADRIFDFFQSIACRYQPETTSSRRETVVNWPFSPRYALKSALERRARFRASLPKAG